MKLSINRKGLVIQLNAAKVESALTKHALIALLRTVIELIFQ